MSEAERRAFLNTLPKEIRDQVNKLLAADEAVQQKDLLKPVVGKPTDLDDYEIIREIGRGGMGIVYEAQQLSLARTVALKVLPFGLFHNPNALQRFQLEAKSAARLHHSNIVPIYDVGCDREQCYYAMQYIEGQTLANVLTGLKAVSDGMPHDSDLSDTMKMGLSSTTSVRKPFYCNVAAIFQCVADALHYAHENGMVHRDIKPANLMLDLNGTVWVTDFGLVKTEESDLTETGDVVGTLRYMSPERFSGLCDRRSDVYSLGMTLYELLSQQPAFANTERLPLIEAIRSDSPESLRKIDRQIPRDLETIVEKAIEKDPRRRYSTAGEMADDLGRFISGQPIQARRVGNTEKLWLWAKKRKALASSLVALLTLLVFAAAGSAIAAVYFRDLADRNLELAKSNADRTDEANAARQEALEEAKTIKEMLSIFTNSFESANFKTGSNYQMTASEVLLKAREELSKSDLDDGARATMLWSLATTFMGIGEFEQALEPAKECYELTKKSNGSEDGKTLRAMTNLANTYHLTGRLDEALAMREKIVALKQNVIGVDHPDTLIAKSNLASSYDAAWRKDESLKLDREVLASHQRIHGPKHRETISAMRSVASTLSTTGQLEEAFDMAEKALELSMQHVGPEHPDTIEARCVVAACLSEMGRREEALELRKQAVALSKKIIGPEHPHTVSRMNMLASSLRSVKQYEAAIKLLREIIPLSKKSRGESHPETLIMMTNLGRSLSESGRLDDAIELQEKTLNLKKKFIGPEHPNTFQAMANLAASYEEIGRSELAHDLKVETLKLTQQVMGEEHPDTLIAIGSLASSHTRAGRKDQALELLQKRLHLSIRVLGLEHRDTLQSMTNVAVFYAQSGRMEDAVELQKQVFDNSKKGLGAEDELTLVAMANLALGYGAVGRKDEAIQLQEDVFAIRKRVLGQEHPATLSAGAVLAWNYGNVGRFDESVELSKANYEAIEEVYGPEHPRTLDAIGQVAMAYNKAGKLESAVEMAERRLAANRKFSGAGHASTLDAMNSLASTLSNNRIQLSRALQLFHECYQGQLKLVGSDHRNTQNVLKNLNFTLANSLNESQQWMAEEKWGKARALLEDMAKYHGSHDAVLPFVREHIVFCEISQRKFQSALDLIESFEMDDSWGTFESIQASRAACLLELNRTEEAMAAAKIVLEQDSGFKLSEARAESVLSICLARQKEIETAKKHVARIEKLLESEIEDAPGHELFMVARTIERMIKFYELVGDSKRTARWNEKLTEVTGKLEANASK